MIAINRFTDVCPTTSFQSGSTIDHRKRDPNDDDDKGKDHPENF
jgi:hypothetical protein